MSCFLVQVSILLKLQIRKGDLPVGDYIFFYTIKMFIMVSQKGFRDNYWHFESKKKKTYRQNQINWLFQYGDVINP